MDTAALLSRLREQDVRLWVDGDRLKCSAPSGALDDEMRTLLASRKDEVIAFLRQAAALKTSPSTIVPIKPDGRRPPIFAVSGHGGDVFSLVALARHMHKEQPVLGVQPPGLDGAAPLTSVEALARFEIEQIRRYQPEGPYRIVGHCAGGTIAFEVAQQLTAAGQKLALVALIGSPFSTMFRRAQVLLFYLRHHARALVFGSPGARPVPFMSLMQGYPQPREAQAGLSPAVLAELAAIRRVDSATVAAVRRYRPKVYSGEIDLFITADEWHQALKWRALAGTTREHRLGDFEINDLLLEPNVEVLAAALRQRLEMESSHA
ncbi:MAG TPA: alpha/beta fold hydrolase [Xanthobacteraceae bacterium]|jgi:thioesterase domain-containing protein